MHFPKVLAKFNCTPSRLRQIFTCDGTCPPLPDDATAEEKAAWEKTEKRIKKDYEYRRKKEQQIWDRVIQGVRQNAESSRIWQAVDMAMDATPVQSESVPLMLWAQGKLKQEDVVKSIHRTGGDAAVARFVTKDPKKDGVMINIPRITEVNFNIVRSYTTRRLAAMDALFANLWPNFRYDPRGQTAVAQLRGDVVTQKVDIMSDEYGYRHLGTQCRRHMLMYSQSVIFPRAAWDRQIGWKFKPTNDGTDPSEVESYVTREGVDFVNPHRTRVFYDTSAPLNSINTGTGPKWIGYWDVVRYGTLCDAESSYYNTKEIYSNDQWSSLVGEFPEFFGYYCDPCVMKYPTIGSSDPRWNDRKTNVGKYSADQRDMGCPNFQYFEEINPKTEGIGDYDCNIWVRYTVAGAGTIIGSEFMPSLAACVGEINVNDNRLINQSMASELLSYQDQMSNIISHMLAQLRTSFVQLWLLDKDSLDASVLEEFKAAAGNKEWWLDPKLLLYSSTKLKEMNVQDPRQAFAVIQAQIGTTVGEAISAMNQILNLADRLMILSPNELGQPNPREVAAREVQEISTSVQAIYSFINQGPREQIAAMKKLLYESLITQAQPIVRVPVMRRYTLKTIRAAGFDVTDNSEIESDNEGQLVATESPIQGNLTNLIYDYYFDSRDGAERSLNTQGAQALTQLLQMLTTVPGLAQKLGMERLLDLINGIIRMSGAPTDLQLEMNDGESDQVADPSQAPAPAGQPGQPAPAAPAPALPGQPGPQGSPAAALQVMDQRVGRIEDVVQQLMQMLGAGSRSPTTAPGLPAPMANGSPTGLRLAS